MDCRQRRFLLAVVGHALDADPGNVAWFATTMARDDLDVLHFVAYDSGVNRGVLLEAQARSDQVVAKRRRRKHREAKARR